MRRTLTFACEASLCAATLDPAPGATGLLIVSGGNEIRVGAHAGMARLAAHVAAHGAPVLRFDRRGVGDSEGENRGYTASAPDIAAAVTAFRTACPAITRIVGFGNCDAATALALFGRAAGIDALLLANPWAVETSDGLPPAAAIRHRYRQRLLSPGAWRDLLAGRIALGKLARGLTRIARPPRSSALANRLAAALATAPSARILCAEGDATAIAFTALWHGPRFAAARAAIPLVSIPTASHSFADEAAEAKLFAEILAAVG